MQILNCMQFDIHTRFHFMSRDETDEIFRDWNVTTHLKNMMNGKTFTFVEDCLWQLVVNAKK